MRTRNFVIKANSSSGALGLAGNYLRVEEASAPFNLRLGNRANVEIDQGCEATAPRNWEQIELINNTASDITVKMVLGETDKLTIRYFRVVGDVTVNRSSSLSTIPDVQAVAGVATKIVDAGTRKVLHVGNTSMMDVLRWGDSSVAANRGGILHPGMVLEYSGEAALYVFNPSGADVPISITEEL